MFLIGNFYWNFTKPPKTQWWEKFIPDLDRDLIEAVCHQVLDIYSKPNAKKSAATPGKGATPAKKAKLGTFLSYIVNFKVTSASKVNLLHDFCLDGDKSVPTTPLGSEKSKVQEELKKLLSGVDAATLQTGT